MDKQLRDRLNWLNQQLTESEPEPEFLTPPGRKLSRAERSERQTLQKLDPVEKRSVPVVKKPHSGLLFLLILAALAFLFWMGWWKV